CRKFAGDYIYSAFLAVCRPLLVPRWIEIGAGAWFLRAGSDVRRNDIGGQALYAAWFSPVLWLQVFMGAFHPVIEYRSRHSLHEATHLTRTIVVTNPYGSGVLWRVTGHPAIFGIIGRTGFYS